MPFAKITPKPGVSKPGTRYDARGAWYHTHLVRWHEGVMQAIGGWGAIDDGAGSQLDLSERCCGSHSWTVDAGAGRVVLGTPTAVYLYSAGSLDDITPSSGFTGGVADAVFSVGTFGAGLFGAGPFGIGDDSLETLTEANTWQIDNYGEDLVLVAWSDGDLWYYDTSAGGNAAVITPSAGTVPTGNLGVVVSPEDFILLLGANSNGRRIQWPDQLDHTNWDVTDITNSAGFLDLPGKGAIMAGRRGQEETLVWTRTNLFAVRFIGGELVYTAVEVGQEGAVSRRAMAMLGSKAFCMSGRGFHVYDGYTRDLPCTLSDYVFSDLNRVQASKIWAETRSEFGEVIWHYPSGSSTECDRAIVYNDNMGIWYPLEIARTGGEDQGALPYPLAVDAAGLVWQHESGSTYTGVTGAPYAETGPFELGNGDVLMDLLSLIPDEKTLGDLDIYLFTSEYPTAAETESGPYTPANPTDLRLTARQARLKIAQANPGWRFGTVRLEVQPGSAR